MTNEEKILQMLSEMNDRITNIDERVTSMDEHMADMSEQMTNMDVRLTHVESEVVKINITIENDIMKRLNLLTDGYILTHEKQYEMESKFGRKTDALEKRVEALEIKAG
jgi:uncharacterized coiled-coil protein SlyX